MRDIRDRKNGKIYISAINNNYKSREFFISKVHGETGFDELNEFDVNFINNLTSADRKYLNSELIALVDGTVLDLEVDKDYIAYRRSLYYDDEWICRDKNLVDRKRHSILMVDIEESASAENKKLDIISDSFTYLASCNDTAKANLALYLGLRDYEDMSESLKSNALKKACMDDPKKIMYFKENRGSLLIELEVKKAIQDRVIVFKDGYWHFKNNILSATESGIIKFLYKDKSTLNSIRAAMRDLKNVNYTDLASSNDRTKFLEAQVKYVLLTNRPYSGEETEKAVLEAIEDFKNLNSNKQKIDRIQEVQQEWRERYNNKELKGLVQAANKRKDCIKEEWESFKDDKEKLINYLFNKEFNGCDNNI